MKVIYYVTESNQRPHITIFHTYEEIKLAYKAASEDYFLQAVVYVDRSCVYCVVRNQVGYRMIETYTVLIETLITVILLV